MSGSWDAMVSDELSRMQIFPTSSQAGLASFSTRPRPTLGTPVYEARDSNTVGSGFESHEVHQCGPVCHGWCLLDGTTCHVDGEPCSICTPDHTDGRK